MVLKHIPAGSHLFTSPTAFRMLELFLAVWALWDWTPLTSPTSLFPDIFLVSQRFSQHSGLLLFPTPSPAPLHPCLVPLLMLSSLQLPICPIFQGTMKSAVKVFFCPHHVAGVILVPQPGIETTSPALEARSLNHWIARQVPSVKRII